HVTGFLQALAERGHEVRPLGGGGTAEKPDRGQSGLLRTRRERPCRRRAADKIDKIAAPHNSFLGAESPYVNSQNDSTLPPEAWSIIHSVAAVLVCREGRPLARLGRADHGPRHGARKTLLTHLGHKRCRIAHCALTLRPAGQAPLTVGTGCGTFACPGLASRRLRWRHGHRLGRRSSGRCSNESSALQDDEAQAPQGADGCAWSCFLGRRSARATRPPDP